MRKVPVYADLSIIIAMKSQCNALTYHVNSCMLKKIALAYDQETDFRRNVHARLVPSSYLARSTEYGTSKKRAARPQFAPPCTGKWRFAKCSGCAAYRTE